MKKIRILLADDHCLVRRGAREVLQVCKGWRVVGEAANGVEAVAKAKALKPDVAIIDIGMPVLDGVQATGQIRELLPNTKILVLTMHESHQVVQDALSAGAHGYCLKGDLSESLVRAVKEVSEGKLSFTPRASEIVLEGFAKAKTQELMRNRGSGEPTHREIEVIGLLAKGRINKEVAEQLGIAVSTVETHRARIMHKLNLHSLAELIHYALRNNIESH